MTELHGQLDWMGNDLGDRHTRRVFPETLDWGEKIYPECEWRHPWTRVYNEEREKWRRSRAPAPMSVCFWPWDRSLSTFLPHSWSCSRHHAFPAVTSCVLTLQPEINLLSTSCFQRVFCYSNYKSAKERILKALTLCKAYILERLPNGSTHLSGYAIKKSTHD